VPNDVDTDINDLETDDFEITDEELTALALAAVPNEPFADDAVPIQSLLADGEALLPQWYMPVSASRARRDWRSRVSISLAVGLVFISSFGICVTNGFPQIF
jgi:hypothetical protein